MYKLFYKFWFSTWRLLILQLVFWKFWASIWIITFLVTILIHDLTCIICCIIIQKNLFFILFSLQIWPAKFVCIDFNSWNKNFLSPLIFFTIIIAIILLLCFLLLISFRVLKLKSGCFYFFNGPRPRFLGCGVFF